MIIKKFRVNKKAEIDNILQKMSEYMIRPLMSSREFDIIIEQYTLQINLPYLLDNNKLSNIIAVTIIKNLNHIYPLMDPVFNKFSIITNLCYYNEQDYILIDLNIISDPIIYIKEIILIVLKVNKLLAFS